MKKIIALCVMMMVCVGVFAGGGQDTPKRAPIEPTMDYPTLEEITPLEQNTPPPVVKADRPYRIVFTFFNGKNPVARDIENSMIVAAEEAGVDLWTMDNMLDPIQMNANVDMAIAAGDVDLYILYTNDTVSNPQLMTKLTEAGIPVLSIATEAIAANGVRAPQFNVPDYKSGFASAAYVGEKALEKGWTADECVFFEVGLDTAGGAFLIRNEGAYAGIQSVMPGIEIVDSSSDGDVEIAFQRTLDFLQTLPKDKKFIGWTHSDDASASMLAAIQQSGRADDSLLVSNGLARQMVEMIRADDGIFVGSMDISYHRWGSFWMPHIVSYLNDGTQHPWIINAPFNMITPDNIEEYYPAQ